MPELPPTWEETRKQGYWLYMMRRALFSWSLFVAMHAILAENIQDLYTSHAPVTRLATIFGVFMFVLHSGAWLLYERTYAKSARRHTETQPST